MTGGVDEGGVEGDWLKVFEESGVEVNREGGVVHQFTVMGLEVSCVTWRGDPV